VSWSRLTRRAAVFSAMQNTGSLAAPVLDYVFDVMVLAGMDVMSEPLHARLKLLKKKVLRTLSEPVRFAGALDAPLAD
jgi:ATP-dependent DNA ligase